MKTFLYSVAEDLIHRFGNNLSQLTIVFPGKRASMFMNNYLTECAGGPVWAPRYTTIDEMFQSLSPYHPSETIRNVCELYQIYQQTVANPMELDEFYSWGEILMSDFEDIDKHMVDADKLFCNASDLVSLEQSNYLSDEQLHALQIFFANFSHENQSIVKQHFLALWKAMPQMYHGLQTKLASQGLMYKGALYRKVAEHLTKGNHTTFPDDKYALVGFNVLDDVESSLFQALNEHTETLFYWDYDNYYTQGDNEAGLFMRENLKRFPNALPASEYNNLGDNSKKIRFIATSTDNAQARYLPTWLKEKLTEKEHHSAVVLCDEGLAKAVLHSIPSKAEAEYAPSALNVTMGYPLPDTPIHGYFIALLDLQVYGYDTQTRQFRQTALKRVTSNPLYDGYNLIYQQSNRTLLEWLREQMETLGKQYSNISSPDAFDQLYAESVFQIYCTVNQFHNLIAEGTLPVKRNTLARLIRQALQSTSVPFHGEMDEGLQVMGLLETRNLDFQHLVMLSVEEGKLPKKADDTSLIPYCLKNSFNLNTIERKTAVFAYYFYRILQRAEDITLMFNETSSGTAQREASRFLRQLLAETDLKIETIRLEPELTLSPTKNVVIEKTVDIMQILSKRFDRMQGAKHDLSPSALGTYLTCPVKFFYQYIAELSVPTQTEDGIDSILFGTLFHDSAEFFYRHMLSMKGNGNIQHSDLEDILKHPDISLARYVNLAFWTDVFHADEYDAYKNRREREEFLLPFLSSTTRVSFNQLVDDLYRSDPQMEPRQYFSGINLIIHNVLIQYLTCLLRYDMEHTPFQLCHLEEPIHGTLEIDTPAGKRQVNTGGRIDRIDIVNMDGKETLRIVDYKTGMPKSSPKDIESIFLPDTQGAEHYFLQTFLYGMLIKEKQPNIDICPCLFYVTKANDPKNYSPTLTMNRKRIDLLTDEMLETYRSSFVRLIKEIFDPSIPFRQTGDKSRNCTYCDFRKLCY